MNLKRRCFTIVYCTFAALAGCSANSTPPVAPINTGPTIAPSPTPTPTAAAPGSVVLNPSSVSLLGVGSAFAMNVNVTQTGNANAFTFTTPAAGSPDSCSTIASETQLPSNGAFSITPLGVGHCTFTVSGENGQSAILTVDVTSSTVGGQ
jgi:hypothetical protein